MAHDANFVGNRLRLSAFLQCVEHGEMPARPLRFRQRRQILDMSFSALAPGPSRAHCSPPLLKAYNESPVLASKSPAEAGAVKSNAHDEAATTDRPLHTNVKGPMNAPSTYDIPCSPTADLNSTPSSIDDRDSRNSPVTEQCSLEPRSFLLFERHATCALPTTVEKAPGNTTGLLSARNRRLPVHELALLRTTTLDGLPLPSDVTAGLAVAITVVDPIEDIQIHTAVRLSNPPSGKETITKSTSSPRTALPSNQTSSFKNRLVESPTRPFQRPAHLSTNIPRCRSGFRDAFDGFVGPELKFTSNKRLSRRRKAIPIRRQKPGIMRELVLRAGSPLSSAECNPPKVMAPPRRGFGS